MIFSSWTLLFAAALTASASDQDRQKELWTWAAVGQARPIEKLLAEPDAVEIDARDEKGWTALMFAARAGHPAVVTLLLDAGANVNVSNEAGETPLHLAAKNGREDVARLLLNAGANMAARDGDGRTPLYRAIEHRHAEVIELLQVAARARSYRTRSVLENAGDAVTEAPKLVDNPLPSYTDTALEKRIEGTVVLRILVRRDGAVGAVRVIEGLEESLDRSAERAVKKWRFEPAMRGGKTVNVVIDVDIDFQLPGP